MAGGIDFSIGAAESLGEGVALATVSVLTGADSPTAILNSIGITVPTLGPYRDKQQNRKAVYSITIPAQDLTKSVSSNNETTFENGVPTIQGAGVAAGQQNEQIFVFDAVLVANHQLALQPTEYPLQSGYNISYHAVRRQPVVTLEVGMSDAMAAFRAGMWSSNASKSVSAFQILTNIQASRILLTLATRQQTYKNMLITNISSPESNKTFAGMKAIVTFKQIFIVDVASSIVSARPNATDSTQQATLQTEDVMTSTVQQNQVTSAELPVGNSDSILNEFGVPAGGAFSSNNIAGLGGK